MAGLRPMTQSYRAGAVSYTHLDEDVVLGLGLHGQRNLADAQTHNAGYRVEERQLPVQAWSGNPLELAEVRDDCLLYTSSRPAPILRNSPANSLLCGDIANG